MLSAKAQRDLIVMMASKADANTLIAMIASNGPVDDRMLKRLEIALGSKKLAAEMKARIETTGPEQISAPLSHDLDVAIASEADGQELENEVENN